MIKPTLSPVYITLIIIVLLSSGWFLISTLNVMNNEVARSACKAKSAVIMRAVDWKGRIVFSSALKTYVVSYFEPGSVDGIDDGILCTLPPELQHNGQLVTFSGNYRNYTGPIKPLFGGHLYYYLELTSIRAR